MVLKGIAYGHGGVSDNKGRPLFLVPYSEHQFDIRHRVVLLCSYCVFPQAVSFCAPCPCYLMSWWRRSRAFLGAAISLSIYMCPSRLLVLLCVSCWRLVVASRLAGLSCVSVCRLVVASCRLVSFRFVLVSCSWRMRGVMLSVECLMSIASHRGRLVSLRIAHCVSCPVSPLRVSSRFSVSFSSRSVCSSWLSWREAGRAGCGVGVLVIMWSERWRSALVFLICSAGRGTGRQDVRRFIQLVFFYSHSRGGGLVRAHSVMVSIWDEMMEREEPMR